MNPEITRLLSNLTIIMLVFWAFKVNRRIKDLENKVKGR